MLEAMQGDVVVEAWLCCSLVSRSGDGFDMHEYRVKRSSCGCRV